MKESSGYIYILANPSMPGLVKIGKTKRTPEERVKELSGATGVPTAFFIIYEKFFHDCDSAEICIHTTLESMGARLTTNREFFNTSTTVAINTVINTPETIWRPDTNPSTNQSSRASEDPIGEQYFTEAEEDYFGHNNHLVDIEKAKRGFQQAARLNILQAHTFLSHITALESGLMHHGNLGVDAWQKRAHKKIVANLIPVLRTGIQSRQPFSAWLLGNLLRDYTYLAVTDKGFEAIVYGGRSNINSSFCIEKEATKCFVTGCKLLNTEYKPSNEELLLIGYEILKILNDSLIEIVKKTFSAKNKLEKYGKERFSFILLLEPYWKDAISNALSQYTNNIELPISAALHTLETVLKNNPSDLIANDALSVINSIARKHAEAQDNKT